MLPYLLHVSIIVAGSYFFYTILLGKETFFGLNRWVLIGCILAAFALPFLEIPEEWSIRPTSTELAVNEPFVKQDFEMPSLENHVTVHQHNITDNQTIEKETIETPQPVLIKKSQWNWWAILKYTYLTGLVIFGLNFLIQLFLLIAKIIKNPSLKDGSFRIVEMNQDMAPFSFLNIIFINPAQYDWETYNHILNHEKIHIKGKHTFDILLAELMVIIQWFNPFAWLYRKAIENNLEYLTDLKMLKEGADRKAYQMNLLKVSVPNLPLNLTTNYNQSILKKRILMMNAKKSSVRSSWKYFFLLPALGLSVICLNAVKTSAQFTDNQTIEQQPKEQIPQGIQEVIISKDEPVINGGGEKTVIQQGDTYIIAEGMTIYNQEIPPKGTWTAHLDGKEICIQFKSEEHQGNWWARHVCYDQAELKNLSTTGQSEFTLEREAGTISFTGNFDDQEGAGTFSFKENPAFKSYLAGQGYGEVTEKTMFQFALSNMDKSYIAFIKDQGYNPSLDELQALAIHGSSKKKVKNYIDKSKQLGIEKVTLKDIIQFEIHDINMDYVLEMKDLLQEDLSVQDVVQAGIHDLEPGYVKAILNEGYPDMTFDEVVQFGIHDIDANYIKELKAVGLTELKTQEIVQAAIHDIDAEYLKELKGAGFEGLSFNEIIQFGIHDIDGDYIQKLRSSGLDLTTNEMVQAAIHDIDADYIRELKSSGFEDLSFDEVVQFGIHEVDANYIRELKSSGLNLTSNEMIQAAIHEVSADYIKELKAAGFEDLSFNEVIQFGIHDVDADYAQALRNAGLTDLTSDEMIQAAIHDVDAELIKGMKAAGFEDISFNDIIQFGIHDVDAEYIKELKAAGLTDLSTQDMIQAAIHDVEAQEISEFKSIGYDLNMQEIVQFSIHDVDAQFIQSMKSAGFDKASHQDLIQAKIHDVDADFIKKAKADGHNFDSLQEYVQLKVNSYARKKRRVE